MRTALLLLLACIVAVGCKKECSTSSSSAAAPTVVKMPVERKVNEYLLDLSQRHKLDAKIDGDWVVFSPSGVKMNGGIGGDDKPDSEIVQVDFRLLLPDGRMVVQEVVGWAKNHDAAIVNAGESFQIGTFHALIGGFIDPKEEHATRQRRKLAGVPRTLIAGETITKLMNENKPPSHEEQQRWQSQLFAAIDDVGLPAGTHWLDIYHGWIGDDQQLEIQLDNERWTALENKVRGIDWPRIGKFTSVRQFIVVQDDKP